MTVADKSKKYNYLGGAKRRRYGGKVFEEREQLDIKKYRKRLRQARALAPLTAERALNKRYVPGKRTVVWIGYSSNEAFVLKRRLTSDMTTRKQDVNLIKTAKTSERKAVSSQIDELYDAVGSINELLAETPNNAILREKLAESLSDLRRLQSIEAQDIERRFNKSLLLPLGMGEKAIEDANTLIQRYENSATKDSAAQ